MDPSYIILRILHIVFGVFWVGTDVFLTFVLIPRLRALGPAVERPVMATLMRVVPPIIMVSAAITAISGVVLMGVMQGWSLAGVLAAGWGWAMLVGFIGTLLALVVGFGLLPPVTVRFDRMNRRIEGEGRVPTPDEGRQLRQLTARATSLARTNSVVLVIVVLAMAVARYV